MVMSDYSIFSVLGLEIEYMLVDKTSLNVQPKVDVVLEHLAGELVNEVVLGDMAISNELVMHAIELKTHAPMPLNTDFASLFHGTLLSLIPLLDQHDMQLLPTGAHPWMNPSKETKRWPHGDKKIYDTYDAIFDCRGHGWSNLQSMHVNLPFANDEEFFHLHSLTRLILPLIPALAASTPILDGQRTGRMDSRLHFYNTNQQRIPAISGNVIPEFVRSRHEYEEIILKPMYRAIHAFDPEQVLQEEWLNSRAAIPKFERMSIEIRITDSQECAIADIAIAKAIHYILKNWYETSDIHIKKPCSTESLRSVYDQTIEKGFATVVDDSRLLASWNLPKRALSVRDIWSMLLERVAPNLDDASQQALEHILRHGNLSERILNACSGALNQESMQRVYRELGYALLENTQL